MSKYDDLIDLSKLGPPKLVDLSGYDAQLSALMAAYKLRYPDFEDETEFEPVKAHFGVDAWLADNVRDRINEAGKATLLASAGGSDLEVIGWSRNVERKVIDEDAGIYEDDDDLRERIHMAPESWSTAGPQGGYEFWAETVEAVKDAQAISPSPAVVEIYVVGHDTSVPATEGLLADVTAAISADNRRPIADRVSVHSADIVPYDLVATIKVQSGPSPDVIQAEAEKALAAYQESRAYIGKSLPASALYAALTVAGAEEVSLSPAEGVTVTQTQIAHCNSVTINVEVINV
ncbi:Phage-related baseplate assembly protein [Cohaesibacter sp. ES.047]|uniref:baseplate assembly protein n=1 Tax=Cohaesibacter sp. ES.047 TaxID=1798205 RepID=UPI000BB72286|nr:baseplate J/gp47 family protein [Cohaesibacter sp. ES.047]SNY91397.1 Phage-related baseplate assembly protein [Cohaesibacter sp. ES.047]